jgi:hypothetical protein
MGVFNIKIELGEDEVTLTILPAEEGYYKVIYFGGILGAIRPATGSKGWEKLPDEELEAGDLPVYKNDPADDRLDVTLDVPTVQLIGEQILINQ